MCLCKAVRICASFTLAVVLCGCGPRIIMLRGGPTPLWVDRLPRRVGELCAVGYSGPTFYQQDCNKNAAENARSQLANSISVTIRSVTIDISDGTRGYFSQDVFVEGSKSASEAVIQGSEVQAQWIDMQGERGPKNSCYALVCIDPTKPVEKLVEKLAEKRVPIKTVERVRTDARAAFKELEQAGEQGLEKQLTPPPVKENRSKDALPKIEKPPEPPPPQNQPKAPAPPLEQDTPQQKGDGPMPALSTIKLLSRCRKTLVLL